MEEQEYYEHYIDIDEMMELKLKIPKHLNVLELKALMVKTDKLFKVSEVKIVKNSIAGQRRSEAISYRKQNIFKKDVLIDIVNLNERKIDVPVITKYLNDKYGKKYGLKVPSKRVHTKIWYLKNKSKNYDTFYNPDYEVDLEEINKIIPSKRKYTRKVNKPYSKYSNEITNTMIIRVEMGETSKEVRDFINKKYETNFSKKQIADKIYQLRKKGVIKK